MSSFVAMLTNMFSGGQKNRVALSLTVGISVILLLSSSFWIYSRNSPRIKSDTDIEEDGGEIDAQDNKESDENEDPCPALSSEASEAKPVLSFEATTSTIAAFEAEVVDVDYEDEDDEETKLAELKTKYDDAVRLATKLIQGNAYKRAIEKLTEALELAQIVSPSSKDIISLYNNRSAMHLKDNNVALAMQDITVLLALDPKHIKGRVRRAKLFEEQNKLMQSLDDYMAVTVFCRFSSQNCPVEESKIEALAKQVAQQRTPQLVATLAANGTLPSRSHCKNFFDTFPSVHLWRDRFEETNSSQGALISQLGRLESSQPTAGTPSDSNIVFPVSRELLNATLQMVCYELYAQNAFKSAFKRLNELQKLSDVVAFVKTLPVDASTYPTDGASVGNHYLLLALQLELLGTEKQLMYSMDAALEAFEWSSKMWALHQESRQEQDEEDAEVIFHEIDVKLKVAAIYLEGLQEEKAHEICRTLLESSAPCFHPWVYIHRCTFWLNRTEKYELKAGAIDAASADIESCLSLTKDTSSSQAESAEWSDLTEDQMDALRNAARFIALLRFIYINTQIKNQAGVIPSESDLARNKTSLEEIKELFPKHEAVLQLEVDALTQEGEPDKAMALLDRFKKSYVEGSIGSEMDTLMEVTLILLKASVQTAKAFMMLQNHSEMLAAQELFPQIEELYKEALSLDPVAIEVSAQYAQLKSMILGDFDGAINLLKAALPIARTRIEVVELCTMLVMNEAQSKAIKENFQV